jgi:hypothetical protein
MSNQRREGEHRVTEQYRESLPYGSRGSLGIGQAAPWFAICFLIVLLGMILGGWMLVHWIMTDGWNTHPMAVLTLYALLVFAVVFWCFVWPIYKAVVNFNIHKRWEHAKIFALNTNTSVTRINAEQHGFNVEYVEGAFASRSVNPLSIAQASKETNNFFGKDDEDANGEEEEDEDFAVPTLLDQLNNGTTAMNEVTSIIGYADGEALRGSLFARSGNLFDSLFAIGDQGFGKSSLGVLIACYTVLHGGKILVIDPDAEEPESLTRRLGNLSRFLMAPVASSPEQALHVVATARKAIESPSGKPVLLLVDEFSYLMRQLENKGSRWNDSAIGIKDISEDYATRGRKRFCRIIAFGQIAKVERTGGSEFRDSCTLLAFHLKRERAQQILEGDAADIASQLVAGEVVVVPRNAGGQAYKLALPYADDQAVARVVEMAGYERAVGGLERVDVEPLEDDFYIRPQAATMVEIDGEIVDSYSGTGDRETGLNGLPDLLVDSPTTRPYPVMNETQVIQFAALYPLMGTDKALDEIKGCNHRHRSHARQIIAEHGLKRKGATQ